MIGAAPFAGNVGYVPLAGVRHTWPLPLRLYVLMHGSWLGLYAFFGKGFAYAGWPPLYVSEFLMILGLVILVASRTLGHLLRTPIGALSVGFLALQLNATAPYLETYGLDTLRDGALWGYSLFAWIVAAMVLRLRGFLHTAVLDHFRRFAQLYLVLGPAVWLASLYLRDGLPHWPGTGISIPLIKGGEYCVHLAGILAFAFCGFQRRGPWIALVLADALLGMGVRGGFLAFAVAGAFIVMLRPQIWKILALTSSTALVVAAMATFEVRLEIPGMAREFSLEQLSDSVRSVIGVSERRDLEGTKTWRLAWWREIREYTLKGPYFWQGKGYGINLADSDGFQVGTREEPLRSPHNSHLTFLARSGVPGFASWVLLQLAWLVTMLRGYIKASRLDLSLWSGFFAWVCAYWIAFAVSASFDVFLEGPMAAIPFWSLFGLGWGGHVIFRMYLKQNFQLHGIPNN